MRSTLLKRTSILTALVLVVWCLVLALIRAG